MKLLEPAKLGTYSLNNRMVMSAMTRSRASLNGVISDLTVTYYTQRSSAGLILSEAINISEQALGSPFTPGIYSDAQVEAWKKVTQAVHEKGGKIFAQLWHTGRVGHSIDRNGELPVAPSAVPIQGIPHFTSQGPKPYETPRALSIEEIRSIVQDYRFAALRSIEAGFDGVELHAANGYLPNQFLSEIANLRTDSYGGSIENNCRFILEVMHELIDSIGGDKVGIKLSPLQPYAGIVQLNPVATYSYLLQQLNTLNLAYIEIMRRGSMFPLLPGYPTEDELELFGKLSKHPVMANGGYTLETGEAALQQGIAEFISYGGLFLANPDLPKRFEQHAPLNTPDRATMFGGNEKGYIDYPFWE